MVGMSLEFDNWCFLSTYQWSGNGRLTNKPSGVSLEPQGVREMVLAFRVKSVCWISLEAIVRSSLIM